MTIIQILRMTVSIQLIVGFHEILLYFTLLKCNTVPIMLYIYAKLYLIWFFLAIFYFVNMFKQINYNIFLN